MQPLFAFEHLLTLSLEGPIPRLLMYNSCIPCAPPGSPRCSAHKHKKRCPRTVFSSNPFDFKQFRTLCTQWRLATPFPSITSALFPIQWRGECISCPSARYSALAPRHRKSCVCHTYDTPGGLRTSLLPNSGRLQQPNRKPAACGVACFRPSVASHCHSSYCVHYRAVPQLARNDGSARKQSRFLRCLMKESGQRVRQVLFAAPGRRSILAGDVGRPETSQPQIRWESRVGKAGSVRLG
jgi:hypothetical protein